jgi:hypothetical protein
MSKRRGVALEFAYITPAAGFKLLFLVLTATNYACSGLFLSVNLRIGPSDYACSGLFLSDEANISVLVLMTKHFWG